MKSYKVYDYTTGEIDGSAEYTEQISFSYENTAWLDIASSLFDNIILYDESGNPVSIGDCDIIWTNGRQLSKIVYREDGTEMLSYTYDDNGIRTSKTYEGRTTYYTTIDGLITSEYTIDTNGSRINEIDYIYNSADEVIAAGYKGKTYYYLKSATGDVVGAADETGRMIGLYQYDAWGNETERFFNTTDADEKHFLSVNPMKYRGYYLDYEMEMYYLQSRYYFSHWCRFFNSDLPEYAQVQKDEQIGTNLFAYCCNNPVNYVDYTGDWKKDVHYGFNPDTANGYYSAKYKGKMQYYGTYYWAKYVVGFSPYVAKKIGYYCYRIDVIYPSTGKNWKDYDKWHFFDKNGKDVRKSLSNSEQEKATKYFETAKKAYAKWKKYCKKYGEYHEKTVKQARIYKENAENGIKHLGYSLHPVQDVYSHTKKVCYQIKGGPLDGRWLHAPYGPDEVTLHLDAVFVKTKNKTTDILSDFAEKYSFLCLRKDLWKQGALYEKS